MPWSREGGRPSEPVANTPPPQFYSGLDPIPVNVVTSFGRRNCIFLNLFWFHGGRQLRCDPWGQAAGLVAHRRFRGPVPWEAASRGGDAGWRDGRGGRHTHRRLTAQRPVPSLDSSSPPPPPGVDLRGKGILQRGWVCRGGGIRERVPRAPPALEGRREGHTFGPPAHKAGGARLPGDREGGMGCNPGVWGSEGHQLFKLDTNPVSWTGLVQMGGTRGQKRNTTTRKMVGVG